MEMERKSDEETQSDILTDGWFMTAVHYSHYHEIWATGDYFIYLFICFSLLPS